MLCQAESLLTNGAGIEPAVLLRDSTSLHLDLLAHERGLKRQAASLYDVESIVRA